jgi:hypothetical protein
MTSQKHWGKPGQIMDFRARGWPRRNSFTGGPAGPARRVCTDCLQGGRRRSQSASMFILRPREMPSYSSKRPCVDATTKAPLHHVLTKGEQDRHLMLTTPWQLPRILYRRVEKRMQSCGVAGARAPGAGFSVAHKPSGPHLSRAKLGSKAKAPPTKKPFAFARKTAPQAAKPRETCNQKGRSADR